MPEPLARAMGKPKGSDGDPGCPRQGQPWTTKEDAQLIREIAAGHGEADLPGLHARSLSAIRARARRLTPAEATAARCDAVRWLAARLAADPDYDWQAARNDHLGPRGIATPPADGPAPAAGADTASELTPQQVRAFWESLTGTTLSAAHRAEFLHRPTATVLATYDEQVLTTAGQRLWQRTGRLRLDEWVLECQWPGLAGLTVTIEQVISGHPEARTALHELVCAAIAETPRDRDRTVLIRRLGLATTAPETLQTIGTVLGLSGERIRQLQQRGLRRLGSRPRTVARAREHAQTVLTKLLHDRPPGGSAALLFELAGLVFPRAAPALAADVLARLTGHAGDHRRSVINAVVTFAREQHQHEKHQAHSPTRDLADTALERLLHSAEWPETPTIAPDSTGWHRRREPPDRDPDDPRRWYSAKLDRTVAYESAGELGFIRSLDRSDHIIDYCEQPLALRYTLDGTSRTYYPDLLVRTITGTSVLIEVKGGGLIDAALWINQAKFTAARELCRNNGWGFLVTDGKRALRLLQDRYIDPATTEFLAQQLAGGPLNWRDIQRLRHQHELSATDIATLTIRHGWRLELNPWRLSLP